MLDHFLGEEPGAEGLAALIDFYLSERSLTERELSCPIPGMTGEAHRMPPAARARFERGIADFRDAIASALAAAGHPACAALATSLFAEMVGAMALARSLTDRNSAIALLSDARQSLKRRAFVVA
jgi:TetR/AcrR family transcriptional repressor of nem operon